MANRVPPSLAWLIETRARIDGEMNKTRQSLGKLARLLTRLETAEARLRALDAEIAAHPLTREPKRAGAYFVEHHRRLPLPHGELTQCLLECLSKAEGAPVTYSGEVFSVPANVDLIGTMNTADRSLALVDTALRRRFDFIARMPDVRDIVGAPLHGLKVTLGEDVIDISRMLGRINERVEALYDRDHTIGHAYFTPLAGVPDGPARFAALGEVFRHRLLPLLEEYFFEDWQKIRLVLADNQKPEGARFVVMREDQDGDLAGLFGAEHGLDSYATKRRYALSDEAFATPAAYVGIYDLDM